MNKPKWQRARFTGHTDALQAMYPDMFHREVWVCDKPYHQPLFGTHDGEDPLMLSNIYFDEENGNTQELRPVNLNFIELLARSPEDFADDVPLIPWERWLQESEPEKTK